MAEQQSFEASQVPVVVSATVPTGCNTRPSAGTITYPYQVGVIANWDMGSEPVGEGHGWPPIERMPSNGLVLWILMGDVTRDNEVEPWEGGGPLGSAKHYDYLAPMAARQKAAGRVKQVAPALSAADQQPSRWPDTTMWNRVLCLADREAVAQKEPYYLQVFGFIGSASGNGSEVNQILESLAFEYA